MTIEAEVDKRGGKTFGPPGNKRMAVFLDDLSMPEVNEWGDQPTLEAVRQLIADKTVCFLEKDKRGDLKIIEDLLYLAAAPHPGSGKNDMPSRLKRQFFIFNLPIPSVESIENIYGQMLSGRFAEAPTALTAAAQALTAPTIKLWQWVKTKFLPTPAKFHYIFSMRDLSRIFQGVLRMPVSLFVSPYGGSGTNGGMKSSSDGSSKATKGGGRKRSSVGKGGKGSFAVTAPVQSLLRLWQFEALRVISDKLTTEEDKECFALRLDEITDENYGNGVAKGILVASADTKNDSEKGDGSAASSGKSTSKSPKKRSSIVAPANVGVERANFVDFLREDIFDEDGILVEAAPKIYESGGSLSAIRQVVVDFLSRYNDANPSKRMNLILFDDALRHLLRISRIIGTPRGSALLVGVGGSGKQSLTRLAAFVAKQDLFQITLTRNYNLASLLDNLRELYKTTGQEGKDVTFLLTEAEIKEETFLEVVNSILMTGEVTGLFPKDELAVMSSDLRAIAMKQKGPHFNDSPENLIRFFTVSLVVTIRCVALWCSVV